MTPITVHKLVRVEREPAGPARIEVELSARPSEGWILILGAKAQEHRSHLLGSIDVYPDVPSISLITRVPLTTETDREILEWLHDVVAATNKAMDEPG